MSESRVQQWFGPSFNALHPLLQHVHLQGAQLTGAVDVQIPNGFAGFLGKRLARWLGIPGVAGQHQLRVDISHRADGMHWDRCFDDASYMRSIFFPIGTLPDGYWIEETGPLKMRLTVDIKNGGWHWRCLEMCMFGMRLPMWLFPHTNAFKTIVEGRYRFYVGFSVPYIGVILAYSGSLTQSSI